MRMKNRVMTIGLSTFLLVACGSAWAQTTAPAVTNAPPGAPVWHGDVATGLSLARGNANTFLLNGEASAENVWDKNDLKFGGDGVYALNNYGQTNQTRAAEAIHGFSDYKRLFTERLYGDLRLDFFHDDVADVRYRGIIGPALGYYFIKTDASKLNADLGASYLRQRLDDDGNIGYAALHASEHGEHKFSKTARVWEFVEYYPELTQWSNYLVNSEAGAEAALNTRFSLRVQVDDHFNHKPATGRKENDILLVSSLVYKY
jgi:putative salt-induced outer membrane protein YdiY